MTDRATNDLAALLTPPPSVGVQFSQAKILSWDPSFLRNTLEWRGITLTDVPLVEGVNALALRVGDVVGMLGWAPENAKGVGSWWILGKLSNPGEFIGDFTLTARQIRFMTLEGNPLAFFGRSTDGDPLTILYYGGSDARRALQIANGDNIIINDTGGHIVFSNDSQSGAGLARPYIPYRMVPASTGEFVGEGIGSGWPSTTSTTPVRMMYGINPVWQPRVRIGVATLNTGGATANWRLDINGTNVTGTQTGSGQATVDIPGWGDTVLPAHDATFEVFGWRTGGTRVWYQCDRFHGVQS